MIEPSAALIELDRCPFCGAAATFDYPRHGGGLARAGCEICKIWTRWIFGESAETLAARIWNRRAA